MKLSHTVKQVWGLSISGYHPLLPGVSARPPLAWTNRQWSQPRPSPRSNAFPWPAWHPSGPWRRSFGLKPLGCSLQSFGLSSVSEFLFRPGKYATKKPEKKTKGDPKKTELVDLNPLSQHSTASDFPLLVRTRLRCNS